MNTGRTVLIGAKDRPEIDILDYIKMSFLGFLLTICIILSFTGIGTIPGLLFGFLIISGLTKNGRFIGIVPFIVCTLIVDILAVVLLLAAMP